jgi:hypothetical protein
VAIVLSSLGLPYETIFVDFKDVKLPPYVNEIVDNCSGLPKLSSVVGIDDGREAAVWVEIDIWREFDVFKVDENSLVGKAKG